MSNTLPIALTRLSEGTNFNHLFSSKKIGPYDHYAAYWVTLMDLSSEALCRDSSMSQEGL